MLILFFDGKDVIHHKYLPEGQTVNATFYVQVARGLERLIRLKYDIVLKRQNKFNLELNAAKNTHRTKKTSNKSCLKLNFVQKSL